MIYGFGMMYVSRNLQKNITQWIGSREFYAFGMIFGDFLRYKSYQIHKTPLPIITMYIPSYAHGNSPPYP